MFFLSKKSTTIISDELVKSITDGLFHHLKFKSGPFIIQVRTPMGASGSYISELKKVAISSMQSFAYFQTPTLSKKAWFKPLYRMTFTSTLASDSF
jgi:hypothetical protein